MNGPRQSASIGIRLGRAPLSSNESSSQNLARFHIRSQFTAGDPTAAHRSPHANRPSTAHAQTTAHRSPHRTPLNRPHTAQPTAHCSPHRTLPHHHTRAATTHRPANANRPAWKKKAAKSTHTHQPRRRPGSPHSKQKTRLASLQSIEIGSGIQSKVPLFTISGRPAFKPPTLPQRVIPSISAV
jgi:hypothetical protein